MAICAVAPAAAAPTAGAQATRTWISGVGADANPCSRTAPCLTLAGTIGKTATGGEINAIDDVDAGPLTITKSLIVDGQGSLVRINPAGGTGITVNAPATADVTIRNVTIDGSGAGGAQPCAWNGQFGIKVLGGRLITIEDVHIDHVTDTAILVTPGNNAKVFLNRVAVKAACQRGISFAPLAGFTVDALIRGSSIESTPTAVRAATGATATVKDTRMVATPTGFDSAGGTVVDKGGNTYEDDAPSTVTTTTPAPTPPPVTSTVTTPTTTPPPVFTAVCAVPGLKGLTLRQVKAQLKLFRCAVGKVTYRTTSKRSQVGRVLSQALKTGTQARAGTKVNVTLGRKKPAKRKKVSR